MLKILYKKIINLTKKSKYIFISFILIIGVYILNHALNLINAPSDFKVCVGFIKVILLINFFTFGIKYLIKNLKNNKNLKK